MSERRFPLTYVPQAVGDAETAVFEAEAVVYHDATRTIHRLGAVAGAVWVCCDGTTTVEAMIGELAEVFAESPTRMAELVDDALTQLADEGLLDGHDAPVRLTLQPETTLAADGSRILACQADT